MAIVQKNSYTPGQNLTNLALNVDANRLGDDKTSISVNYGTTPATVTVAVGSVIEVNGNLYTIESSAESFQMADAAHNYLTFDGTTFSSAATIGTYSAAKQGYYQADNVTRTLKWFIDQTNEQYYINSNSFITDPSQDFNFNTVDTFYYEDDTTGVLLDSTSGTSSNTIIIKKTIVIVARVAGSSTGGGGGLFLDIKYNSSFSTVPKSIVSSSAGAGVYLYSWETVCPGAYRLRVTATTGTTSGDIRLVGVYGDYELDTDRIYEIV